MAAQCKSNNFTLCKTVRYYVQFMYGDVDTKCTAGSTPYRLRPHILPVRLTTPVIEAIVSLSFYLTYIVRV